MRLVLLRHAATAGNEEHRYVGRRTDEPLSKRGIEQCVRFGAFTSMQKVYVSPMLRARQTAERCFPHAQILPVPGLEEFDFGDFEGRTPNEMECDAAYRAWVDGNCEGQCPGGESLEGFVRRTKDALFGLLRAAHENAEDSVVVVAHGGTIMAALDGFYDKHVHNCEGYVVTVRFEGETVMLCDDFVKRG